MQQATAILRPALECNAHIRVHIVEIEPAHLSSSGKANLSIAVWGDPTILPSIRPKHEIFTRNRIDDGPDREGED